MRHARHLHPEWGILAPPQNSLRTARNLLITMAVSATTCAGVILSLVDRPLDETSVAARTFATPADAATTAPRQLAPTLLNAQVKSSQGAIESSPIKATPSTVTQTKPVADLAHSQKKANKKHHAGARYASRGRQFTSLMDDWYHAVGL
jgi:hypothetical protein